ncbi:ClpP/crotonase-like domain-containing protein [Mycena crocata]|nr:ClpP/crotonase-like domain-containing protein [Mycena crocata]
MLRRILRFAHLGLLCLSVTAARYPSYGTLQTTGSSGVLSVVINNRYSSINLFDMHVQSDLANLIETLQANDTDIRVVVFSSANKDMLFPVALLWNITQLPQATIAVIEGRARGIGNEFLMACDMRFASTAPSVRLSQLETSLGVNPGAGGGMYLAQLLGRGRAFEYVLASRDVDGATAARLGWINRAFTSRRALHAYVGALAARIALFPLAGIAGTKAGINAVSRPAMEVLVREAQDVIGGLVGSPEVQRLMERFIVATRNQSVGRLELDYGKEVDSLFRAGGMAGDASADFGPRNYDMLDEPFVAVV